MKKISPLNKKNILFLTLTVLFVLVLSGAASAGTPLQQNQTGTVSGNLYVKTTDGWPSSTQGATNEVTQANTLPAYTSIDSAWVYVNVYSGSGTSNWPVRTTIKLDGNGDGDYDDPGELLGIEDMNIPGSTDGTVYWLNDHCNRVYSDYQVWYNVTGLITSNNPTLYVKTENMGGIDYDGRIKMLALTVAYNDGDTDQVHYWVLNGQDWINSGPSTSTFNTSNFNGQVSSATLNTVALSGTDGTYTLNTSSLTGNLTETGSYYKEHQWDVTSNITSGANTNLTYTNVGSTLKMNLATLTIREAAASDVIYENDFSTDPGLQIVNWLTSTSTARLGGVILFNQSAFNILFECDMHYYRYPGGSGRYITFGLINSTSQIFGPNFHFQGELNNGEYWFTSNQVPKETYSTLLKIDMDPLVNDEWYHLVFITVEDQARLQVYHGNVLVVEKNLITNANSWDGLGFMVTNYVEGGGICAWNQTGEYIQMRNDSSPDELWIDNVLVKEYTGSPLTDFSVNKSSGLSPATIQFTDQSAGDGINYWEWDFDNDGVVDSTIQNPIYTYASPGQYTVKLTVSNAAGSETIIRNNLITVSEGGSSHYDIEWQKSIGGNGDDYFTSIKQTSDGGYIAAGYTNSNNGDIYGNHGGNQDGLIVKYSSNGSVEWVKCIGASGSENIMNIIQKAIGGYLVVGYTNSNTIPGYHSINDGWIVSLDDNGNIEWQKAYGGSGADYFFSVEELSDGFLLGGYTASTNGDVSGSHGGNEIWILKIAQDGTIVWQKCLGGTGSDMIQSAGTVKQTSDGGYIVTGYSASTNGDVSGNHGGDDIWVVKLDSALNIIWQKCLGGTGTERGNNIDETGDGYIITGYTASTNGDVTNNHGGNDVWIIKLNNDGSIQWQYCYGGTSGDSAYILKQLPTGEYLIRGSASSTDGDVTGTHGDSDIWILKISSEGQLLWNQCYGGSKADSGVDGLELTPYGGFILSGNSRSSDGDLSENKGLYDLWIAKFISAEVASEPPVADFTSDVTNGSAPLTVQFTDNSTGLITSITWDFNNDGTIDSMLKNPTYTYLLPGTYTVKLTVRNSAGSDDEVKTNYVIAVADPSAPTVNANHTSQELTSNIQVTLTATDDLDPNPSIYYTTNGTNPTTTSTKYSSPINITKTTTLKFFAMDVNGNTSLMQTETYTDMQAPTTSVSIPGDNLTSAILVVLSATDNVDSNPVIYYTTNGTDPTINSTRYTSALNIVKTTVVKFIAVDFSGNISPVQTETYTDNQAPTINVNPTGGEYSTRLQVNLSATDNVDSNPVIYYTTDGTDPTTSSTQYNTPLNINGTTILKLIAVDITGNISPVKTETYTISDTEAPIVTASLSSGTYNIPASNITLSATDSVDLNPKIYYTLDGTDPTTSSILYTGPITLPQYATTILKFIALDASGNTSPVQTETYTIQDTEAPTATATQNWTTITLSATDNADPNPAIYYTTDETDPTTSSTPYSGSFNIPRPAITLVKFIAVDASGNTSPVESRTFSTYYSTDLLTSFYAEGNIGVVVDNGGTSYGGGDPVYNLSLPADATILAAHLCLAWDWYGYIPYTVSFNGNNVALTAHYPDGNDGQDVYDVTQYFNATGTNTASITGGTANYGRTLIVVYQSASEPYRKIWVNEGFDIIPVYSGYGATEGPGHAFFFNVSNTDVGSAQITITLPSGDNDAPNINLNGQAFTITSTGGSDPSFKYYNINPTAIQNGTNILEVPNGGYMSIANAILTLTMPPVADFTADVVSGFAPLTVQFTDQSTNTTSYAWDFDNNGTVDSTEKDPVWTFAAGTYTIKLTVTGPGGTDDEIKTGLINVDPSMIITNPQTNQVYTTIQDAIDDALTQNGDILTVHNGTYTENIYINKQLTLNTTGVVTINAANQDIPIFTIGSAGNGTSITGFNLTGTTNAPAIRLYSADNCQLINNVITGNNVGIQLYDSDNNTITGNIIQNNQDTGIYINNSTGNTIGSNSIISNGVIGILLREANSNPLTGNNVQNNGWAGIALDNAAGNTINGLNNISGNLEGIHLTNSNGNVIDGNSITGNTNLGVSIINSSTGNTITNTVLSQNSVMGVYLRDSNTNNLTGNTVTGNGWIGVCLDNAVGNTINGANNISGNLEGLYLVNNSNNTIIQENNIHDNQDTGIYINQSTNNTINDNTTTSNGIVGVLLREANENTITGNTVTGNGWVGIALDNAAGNNINGANTISGSQMGVYLTNNSTGNIVTRNNIQNNTWAGLVLETAHNTTVYQNNFINNPLQALAINGTGNQFNSRTTGNHWNNWNNHDPRPIDGNEPTYDLYPNTTAF